LLFTIRNLGDGSVTLTGSPRVVLTPLVNCGAATQVLTQPASGVIPASGAAAFEIYLGPIAPGLIEAAITFENSVASQNPFAFTVRATVSGAVPANLPPGSSTAGSAFSGPSGGPFTLVVDPGVTLFNAVITLNDPEGGSNQRNRRPAPYGRPCRRRRHSGRDACKPTDDRLVRRRACRQPSGSVHMAG
jgi:hypothetical protein